jgi:serine/threonine protein kinase
LHKNDILYIINHILEIFLFFFEEGVVYKDLKPSNIVLVRYENNKENITIYKPCYKIKLIDLSSLSYLRNIEKYKIKKD